MKFRDSNSKYQQMPSGTSQIMATMDCVSKVQLHISCEGLKDKDVLSKSDPICAVYVWDDSYKKWQEVSTIFKTPIIIIC